MLTVNGSGIGTGAGDVGYTVSVNGGGTARTGHLQVNATNGGTGSAQFTVQQNP
jgi:hypothetical protein